MAEKVAINIDDPDTPPSRPPPPPPPPPPKKMSRPKITITIPDVNSRGPISAKAPITPRGAQSPHMYWGPMNFHGRPPTAGSHASDPHSHLQYNPFMHMYHNKASDFMFKQFEGFKDFTMNTAKSGLSAGEKSAFWFYKKISTLSKKWFTHLFLTLCLLLYSVLGAFMFIALEGPGDHDIVDIKQVKEGFAKEIISEIQKSLNNTKSLTEKDFNSTASFIEERLEKYEEYKSICTKQQCDSEFKHKIWAFRNALFYAGTIYTTIGQQLADALTKPLPAITFQGMRNEMGLE